LLKKRKQNAETRAKRARALVLNKRKEQQKKQDIFKRAEKYVREYKKKEQDLVRLRRISRKNKNFYVPAQPSLAFVVRIRGYETMKKTKQKKNNRNLTEKLNLYVIY
jgi:large subunit ribosomal protein L7e